MTISVVIAGNFAFPTGSAAAARIRNLALGLRENGANVWVFSMSPMQARYRQPLESWECKEIHYEHMAFCDLKIGCGPFSRVISKVRWAIGLYGAILPTYRKLSYLINQHQCDLFIGYGRNAALLIPLIQLCRKHKISTVLDVTELSKQFSGWGGKLNPVYWDWQYGEKQMSRKVDLVTTITTCLARRYQQMGCKNTMLLPAIETWNDFSQLEQQTSFSRPVFHLLYIGALIPRDAPEYLFLILRELSKQDITITLDIVGRYETSVWGAKMMQVCREDTILRNHVNFMGEVDDTNLVRRMRMADGLILLRQNADTEICSFPTRLVEYLKQGKPVFVSRVGDVPKYLRDGIDAVLLPIDKPVEAANTIATVAQSADRGKSIGIQGRRRGEECFDRRVHTSRLLNLVFDLK